MVAAPALDHTLSLGAAHARTHLFTVGDSSLSESSICFVPFTDFEVACKFFLVCSSNSSHSFLPGAGSVYLYLLLTSCVHTLLIQYP